MRNSLNSRRNVLSGKRRGAALILALVCLAVTSVILAGILRMTAGQRRQVRYEQHSLQAAWLAESGVERAVNRLRADSSYPGEDWSVTPEQFGGRHGGQIKISVSRTDNSAETGVITAEAIYPQGASQFASRSKQIRINFPAPAK